MADDPKQLVWDGFQYNCGCVEIGDFAGSVETIFTDLKSIERTCKGENWGLLTATTIPSQLNAVEALKQRKFKIVKRFKNPNTGNWVTVWMKRI